MKKEFALIVNSLLEQCHFEIEMMQTDKEKELRKLQSGLTHVYFAAIHLGEEDTASKLADMIGLARVGVSPHPVILTDNAQTLRDAVFNKLKLYSANTVANARG